MKLTVNGKEHSFDGDLSMPVLWYVRDELGLMGAKFGCGTGLCGACTVHVDGLAVRGCVLAMGELDGKTVTTIEGLDEGATTRFKWRGATRMCPSAASAKQDRSCRRRLS